VESWCLVMVLRHPKFAMPINRLRQIATLFNAFLTMVTNSSQDRVVTFGFPTLTFCEASTRVVVNRFHIKSAKSMWSTNAVLGGVDVVEFP
jgi:hypothetical protein